jgi:restriction endonuclease S subunit
MTISTYNGTPGDFYIQCKGLHSGKPLKNPIPNCFSIQTDISNAYEIVYSLWRAKRFYNCIGGSVVPFIRLSDVKKIVFKAIEKAEQYDTKSLKGIELIDAQIENTLKRLQLLKEMQQALALKANRDAELK